ncbi:mitochondrial inner membrane protease subunit 2 protein [Rutstroemia sp. NJR-2017a BBW]|nr:mitochondrial inner membrane protease subunit 2 protein [Rutstroemia sp. NJR-2017a BBW]
MSQRLFSTIKGAKVPKFLTEFTYYSFALVSWVPAVIFFNDHVAAFQFVNGPSIAPYPYPYADVPAGHVWLEGDNAGPNKSLDSNHYGPISMSLITGQLKYIVWPRSSFGHIRWWEFKGKTRVIKGWNTG